MKLRTVIKHFAFMTGIHILLHFTLSVQIMLISYEILYFEFNYHIMTVWEEKQKVIKNFIAK